MTVPSFLDLLLETHRVMIDGRYAGSIHHVDYPRPELCWISATDDDQDLGCSVTFGQALGAIVTDWTSCHRRLPATITVRTVYARPDGP